MPGLDRRVTKLPTREASRWIAIIGLELEYGSLSISKPKDKMRSCRHFQIGSDFAIADLALSWLAAENHPPMSQSQHHGVRLRSIIRVNIQNLTKFPSISSPMDSSRSFSEHRSVVQARHSIGSPSVTDSASRRPPLHSGTLQRPAAAASTGLSYRPACTALVDWGTQALESLDHHCPSIVPHILRP